MHFRQQAFDRWMSTRSPNGWVQPVLEWLDLREPTGPPADAIDLEDDMYLSVICPTRVVAEYLVVGYERLAVLRNLR